MNTKEKFFAFGLALLVLVFINIVLYPYLGNRDRTTVSTPVVPQCEKRIVPHGARKVVLRVDDIQAYSWRETSIRMIEDAEKEGIPLTLGVIPAGLTADEELMTFLKKRPCVHELALHGWNHGGGEEGSRPEFGELTKEEALARILPGIATLKEIVNEPVVTWIPPLNVHSVGTEEALRELGFTHISTEGKDVHDYDASTFEYTRNTLVSPEVVVRACEAAFQVDNHCIIMLHPQDFTDGPVHNETKYQTYYLNLIDALQKLDVTFVEMRDLEA